MSPARLLTAVVVVIIGPVVALLGLLIVIVTSGNNANTGTVGLSGQLKPGTIPQRYVGLIQQAATTCPAITAPLLAAQIQTESNWEPDAIGPVTYLGTRAHGIAQFMPATWDAVGRDYNGNGATSPMEPGDAIPTQAAYMCRQLTQVRQAGLPGDHITLALAAYNAGLGPVLEYQGIPPYQQTQQYVRRIRGLARTLAQPAPHRSPNQGWTTPVPGTCSSGYGSRWGEFHQGQDIAGPVGTPITAAAAGTVLEAGPASGYGQWVKLQHPGGVVTIYGHIHHATVDPGQHVRAGQVIATRGNRGQSTGPHLHYQINVDGAAVDPRAFHRQHGAPPLCGSTQV
ncbi:murein DD-endopeptidase MepM/ murein hydrolase activator NlpD [Saccharopolyspora lacisalsi]|uniref:Murein DD-endopeptidase MepM/ murein hydrolase activator NlpD n=1 Tax=Halosaccharopolyspora lacisalsi TaxID=1000566 RepID=A0A839E596_9PSEU|nr:peptidoglycan DD-metalloendopeptidase family protein [Halosaccharopolyspora lacisalsi]MBA8827796.1 murein DD-endopeptidase MepM/ murein hydrolase activator NlpD [Halosaccharopolyspora lacisalsi]